MPTAPRPNSLQQAASAVFAVTTVLPLLVFVWTLHRLGALSLIQSQFGLGLALGIALLGYYIFRRLIGQMSDLIRGLGRAVERGARSASDGRPRSAAQERAPGLITEYKPPAVTVPHPAPATSPPAAPAATAPNEAPAHPAVLELDAPRPQSVPGLGMIQEVDDLSRAMARLWMNEAMAYQGRRVAISIMNSRVPITGTLVDLKQDGLLIEQDGGGQVAVSYSRLSGIDAV